MTKSVAERVKSIYDTNNNQAPIKRGFFIDFLDQR